MLTCCVLVIIFELTVCGRLCNNEDMPVCTACSDTDIPCFQLSVFVFRCDEFKIIFEPRAFASVRPPVLCIAPEAFFKSKALIYIAINQIHTLNAVRTVIIRFLSKIFLYPCFKGKSGSSTELFGLCRRLQIHKCGNTCRDRRKRKTD